MRKIEFHSGLTGLCLLLTYLCIVLGFCFDELLDQNCLNTTFLEVTIESYGIGLIFLKQLSQCQDSFIWSRLVLVACYLLNRRTIAVHTDERVRLTNEMLNAMRIVKMYCWEKLFRGLINKTRK